jgi:hypothetical protein
MNILDRLRQEMKLTNKLSWDMHLKNKNNKIILEKGCLLISMKLANSI